MYCVFPEEEGGCLPEQVPHAVRLGRGHIYIVSVKVIGHLPVAPTSVLNI